MVGLIELTTYDSARRKTEGRVMGRSARSRSQNVKSRKRRYAVFIFAIFVLCIAFSMAIIAAITGALDLYGAVGWRPIVALTLLAGCLLCASYIQSLTSRHRRDFTLQLGVALIASGFSLIDATNQLVIAVKSIANANEGVADISPHSPVDSGMMIAGQTVVDLDFSYQNLTLMKANGATFDHVNFNSANLRESDLRNAVFLNDVEMTGVNLCGADLRGADLSGSKGLEMATDLRFTLIDSQTIFPDYLIPGALEGPVTDFADGALIYECEEYNPKQLRSDGTRS